MNLPLVLSLTLGMAGECPTPDQLSKLMVGKWSGEGKKRSLTTGKVIHMKNCVTSTFVNGFIISENEITEDRGNEIKTYKKSYWMRPSTCADGQRIYEVGGMSDLNKPTSIGEFDGQVLKTVQKLSSDISYELVTSFDKNQSITHGEFRLGGNIVQVDEMLFVRIE